MKKLKDQVDASQSAKPLSVPSPKPAPFSVVRRKLDFPKSLPLGCCDCGCCGGCACFPAGTMVLMADGNQKPIEKVRIGDRLWGLAGINRVVTVETPVLATRTMLQMSDGSLRFSAEHPIWTQGDGGQWWGTHDAAEAQWEIDKGVFGLTHSKPLRELARRGVTYAHIDGWKTLDAIEIPATFYTRLYHIDTDGCRTAIMDGFVVSAGIDDAAFDYARVDWQGLDVLRAAEAELEIR
jgi:Hom_end-associated Hint